MLHQQMTDNMQIDDGRIIVGSRMWSTYNPDQTPNLEAVDNPPSGTHPIGDKISRWSPADIMYDDVDPYSSRHRAIQAFGHKAASHLNRRPRPKDTQANSISTFTLKYNRR